MISGRACEAKVGEPMLTAKAFMALTAQPREVARSKAGDPALGFLDQLPGTWKSQGRGWNMIALPFVAPGGLDYRLLLNQYDEQLNFTFVDKAVPNRGIGEGTGNQTDQFVVALDYEQVVHQVAVTDRPTSTVAGVPGAAIHHEPGLFLQLLDQARGDINIARLATVPHGDAVLALGAGSADDGPATIPAVNGLPIGVAATIDDPYLEPYRFFCDKPFVGIVTDPKFPGFDSVEPHRLLRLANDSVTVTRTTVLTFDTTTSTGGVNNVPFVANHANAVSMRSTFWIQELADTGHGGPHLRMQYLQVVILEFARRSDGTPGLIGWPHVSINTLDKETDTVQPLAAGLTG
jgi:hypothetical protein